MITPLGHRQIYQTAQAEAARQAHDVIEQVQREASRHKVASDRLEEMRHEVPRVQRSDGLRTEEREAGGQGSFGGEAGSEETEEGEAADEAVAPPAGAAEKHLDLLA